MNKAASVIIISLLTIFTVKTFKNPFVYLSLVVAAPLTISRIDTKNKLKSDDYFDIFGTIGNDFKGAWTKQTIQGVKTFFNQPSAVFKDFYKSATKDVQADYRWFSEFRKKSQLIVGISGDGKTSWMLNEVADFIQDHPNGLLRIGDIDYMMAHDGSEPNDWFGLPRKKYISIDYDSIRDDILKFAKLVEDRIKELQSHENNIVEATKVRNAWPYAKLIVDELIGVIAIADERDEKKELIKAIKTILNRGRKARIHCVFGLQNMSVTDSGLSTSAQDSFNVILLGSSALNPDYLKKIDITSSKEQQDIIKEVTELRRVYPYSAIIRSQQIAKPVTIPEFNLNYRYSDPFQEWKDRTFTELVMEALAEYAEMMSEDESLVTLEAPYQLCFADDDRKKAEVKKVIEGLLKKPIDTSLMDWWDSYFTIEKSKEWHEAIYKWRIKKQGKSPRKDFLADAKIATRDQKKGNPRFDKFVTEWDKMVDEIISI